MKKEREVVEEGREGRGVEEGGRVRKTNGENETNDEGKEKKGGRREEEEV